MAPHSSGGDGGGRKKQRARCHDYHQKGTYHIVLEANSRHHLFGTLICEPEPRVALSHIGRALLIDELPKIHQYYPMVDLWKVCVMPDHLHMILRVNAELPEGRSLGNVVKGFKTGCNKMLRTQQDPESRAICGRHEGLFDPGYYDQIIFREDASNWFAYLDDNPRRAVLKRLRPDLFRVVNEVDISGVKWQMVGNCFLLDNPDRACVIVRSFWSEEEYQRHFDEWMHWGEHGGVLVSAAINPREKRVMREALDRGYSIICIKAQGFSPYYKPGGEVIDACAEGRLLQMSAYPYSTRKVALNRAFCWELNRQAMQIAEAGRLGIGGSLGSQRGPAQ